jgi:hypothetical protein
MKELLRFRFLEIGYVIREMLNERRRRIVRSMDSHQCLATYTFQGERAAVKSILDQKPDFEPDGRIPETEGGGFVGYVWLRRAESKKLENQMNPVFRSDSDDPSDVVGTIGKVKLYSDKLVIETFTKQAFEFAKKMVKKYFKKLLRQENEAVVDLAKMLLDKFDRGDLESPTGPKPPEIPREVEEKLMKDFYEKTYTKFMDEPVPALDNWTQRQAAVDPRMRMRLIELMKEHLHGLEGQFKGKGFTIDISWVLDELGLTELK